MSQYHNFISINRIQKIIQLTNLKLFYSLFIETIRRLALLIKVIIMIVCIHFPFRRIICNIFLSITKY